MKHIRIAGRTFKLSLEQGTDALGSQYVGRMSPSQEKITLDTTGTPDSIRSTLLHELIHAADRFFAGNRLSEAQVLGLEAGLWAIFKDNPGLSDIIFKGAKL